MFTRRLCATTDVAAVIYFCAIDATRKQQDTFPAFATNQNNSLPAGGTGKPNEKKSKWADNLIFAFAVSLQLRDCFLNYITKLITYFVFMKFNILVFKCLCLNFSMQFDVVYKNYELKFYYFGWLLSFK